MVASIGSTIASTSAGPAVPLTQTAKSATADTAAVKPVHAATDRSGGSVPQGAGRGQPALSQDAFAQLIAQQATDRPLDLSGQDLRNVDLSGLDLRRANLAGANLAGKDLSGLDLTEVDLTGAKLAGADLTGARFGGARLDGADFSAANLQDVYFGKSPLGPRDGVYSVFSADKVVFDGARFEGATLRHVGFSGGSSFRGTDFAGARLYGTSFGTMLDDDNPDAVTDVRGANFQGAVIERLGFTNANLSGVDLSGLRLDGLSIRGSDVTDTDFTNSRLADANFTHVDLSAARLDGVRDFSGVRLFQSNIAGIDFSGADFSGASFFYGTQSGVVLIGSDYNRPDKDVGRNGLAGTRFNGADFSGASLSLDGLEVSSETFAGANFNGTYINSFVARDLTGISFRGASVGAADLRTATYENLQGAVGISLSNLDGIDLSNTDFSGVNFGASTFRGADLSGINLHGSQLMGSNFTGADLSGANLSDTRLDRATFAFADLSNANLSGSQSVGEGLLYSMNTIKKLSGKALQRYLRHQDSVSFVGADLSGANLSDSILLGADFSGANISGADFTDSYLQGANFRATVALKILKEISADLKQARNPDADAGTTAEDTQEEGDDTTLQELQQRLVRYREHTEPAIFDGANLSDVIR